MQTTVKDQHGSQTGGCLCGAVRYRVSGLPLRSGICHCRSCRKAASAPNLPFLVYSRAALTFTEGEPTVFCSSATVTRGFCGRCGSALTYAHASKPDCIDVMTCSLDDPDVFPPTCHVWTDGKIGWESISDGLPSFSEGSAPS